MENVIQDFTCGVKNVLPGKNSTSFKFCYNGRVGLQSKNGMGTVVENDQGDGTKYVEWKFSTWFNRNDNGGKFSCAVDWKVAQYGVMDLKSKVVEHANITCKCPTLYSNKKQNFVLI